jgi:ABC transport system ATP-binding/permease protein
MSLINCQSISKSFGTRVLFERVSLTIAADERVGLIGPNGSGKTTLIQILCGIEKPDSGLVSHRKMLRLGHVEQENSFENSDTVRSVAEAAISGSEAATAERDELVTARVNVTLGKAGFTDLSQHAQSLSGGWRKRLAIARELLRDPEVLLLDEPTNHLDLDGILWLERLLTEARFTTVVVSHDRYFLENFATSMVEINRVYPEGLFRVRGSYSEFLLKREEFRAARAQQRESLENKVRREVEWLRRGPKARTTKSRARIETAERMIEELGGLQADATESAAQIDFTASGRKTKKLLTAKGVAKSLGGRKLFEQLDFTLTPGMRLGLVGPNGSGKTTLLRVISGEIQPDSGDIERADGLRTVYFDQHRQQLDPSLSLRRALCPHGDSVIYRGRPMHVASWARKFLFSNEQLEVAVGRLSGGERARVAIAMLMLQSTDLLLLDEPTNDLDIPTLEVLEESLLEFPGALVLVTHDRYMLDRVSSAVIALGTAAGMYADYSQWEQARQTPRRETKPDPVVRRSTLSPQKKRLSYNEGREWETIETRIDAAEQELIARQKELHEPEVTRDPQRMQEAYAQLLAAQAAVDQLYERWAELEEKQA